MWGRPQSVLVVHKAANGVIRVKRCLCVSRGRNQPVRERRGTRQRTDGVGSTTDEK